MTPEQRSAMRLDLANELLWRGDDAVHLRPKTLAVLRCLAERAGQVVTKAALCRAVWPDVTVGDGSLMVCIAELRRTLGDDPASSRIIETLPRRGYRLLVPIAISTAEARSTGRSLLATAAFAKVHGRGGEMQRLRTWLSEALAGTPRVVFLSGEVGIGKTTLVEALAEEAQRRGDVLIARGQCVEHYGAGEAYLPILEALSQLCRGAHRSEVIALLGRCAPTWLVQMPWLLTPADRETLERRVAATTRERMLREVAQLIEMLTAVRPLLLVLEDLHWSDPSTRALIAWLARRRQRARLLLVGTYRSTEAAGAGPVRELAQELHIHGECEDLRLSLLGKDAIGEYLAARLTDRSVSAELPSLLHQRTDGNPLFMVNMVEYWLAQRWLTEIGDEWALKVDPIQLSEGIPENVREMIERWLDRLDPEERHLVEAASVAGVDFSAAAVAGALDQDLPRAEAGCARVARQGQLLKPNGQETWPDGTESGRYAFVHALYRDVAYGRVAPAVRVHLHRRIAESQSRAYGARAGEAAAALAMHFERGHDHGRAVAFLRLAAESALRRSASAEAIDHLTRALELLGALQLGEERPQLELSLLTTLGPALTTVKGYGAHEVERVYARARALCESSGDLTHLFPVLRGLVTVHQHRGDLRTAERLARELLLLARQLESPALLLQARQGQGITSFYRGELRAARRRLEWCISHHDPAQHRTRPCRSGLCTAVVCQGHLAWVLWHQGYPDRALRLSGDALALARTLGRPYGIACALYGISSLHQSLRNVDATRDSAESLVRLASEHGFTLWRMYGSVLQGWALAMQGRGAEGRAMLREQLASLRAAGTELARPYFLGLLADACGAAAHTEEGLDAIDEAISLVSRSAERFCEPELHRVRGELLQRDGLRQGTRRNGRALAEADETYDRALAIARRRGFKSLALRVASSALALRQPGYRDRAAARLLSEIYGSFTEGHATHDLRSARRLLASVEP